VVAEVADAAGQLPVCDDRVVILCADEKSSPRQARERRGAVKRLRILLVEDKWRVAQRLKVQLERLGHEVVGLVNDGEQAVGFVWRLEPDLIIMQQHLPIIDGSRRPRRSSPTSRSRSSCSLPTPLPISSGRPARLGSWPTW